MRRRRARLRAHGLLRRTTFAVVLGFVVAVTLISELIVHTTDQLVTAPPGLTYVDTGGFETRFESWGAPSAHPIVLVHGAFESVYYWQRTARILSGSNHVEAYDLKGYGYSTHVGPYDTEALARQLANFLAVRHLENPILVGHSLGAGVIARFVLDHPHEAAGIVFIDGDGLSMSIPLSGTFSWIPDPYRTALYRSVIGSDTIIRTIFHLACGPECPSLTGSQIAAIRRPFEVAGAEDALLAYGSQPIVGVQPADLYKLRSYAIPAKVIFGANDVEFSPDAATSTARRIGAPPPTMIRGAGHLSMWSNPAQVARAIESFARSI